MGTNYYHRTNICENCDRYDEHHIGKSSMGWSFSFHGDKESIVEFNSLGKIVSSFSDWKERLKEGKIFNEYGEEILIEEFLDLVESKRESEHNHTEHCRISHPDHAKQCWLDNEGNSFSGGEFS